MLTKSVKSVISVVLKHVAWAKKSVQSVRSVCYNIRMVSTDSNNFGKPCHDCFMSFCLHSALFTCTTLIINALQSVDKSALCIHATCTCQQSLYTRLHLLALPSTLLTFYLHLPALACILSALTCTRWHHICAYLHSLTLCLHALTHLLTGISTHVF